MLLELGRGLARGRANIIADSGPTYLDSVISSVCCDLDATIEASYGGSGQIWSNLIASPPADSQTDYDFYLGDDGSVESDDPVFTGTAGDPAAYWLYENDKFVNSAASTPQLFKDFHKTQAGNVWWVALAFRYKDGINHLFDTRPTYAAQGIGLNTVSGDLRLLVRGGSANQVITMASLTDGTDYLAVITGDGENEQVKWAVNSTSLTTDNTSWNSSTADGANPAVLFASNANSPASVSGLRLYSFAAGNEYLDNAKLAAIVAHYEARHGRDYTP